MRHTEIWGKTTQRRENIVLTKLLGRNSSHVTDQFSTDPEIPTVANCERNWIGSIISLRGK
jgi:hypothetical protein